MGDLFDSKYKEGTKKYVAETKDAMTAYKQYQKAVLDNSPFDKKTTELMLLSASAAIHCAYCIDTHAKRAKLNGATDKEMAFAINLAATVNHGATVSYGVNGLSK